MKALSLTQPWATLVTLASKRYETRSWSTSYRGPLAIHAAKGGFTHSNDIEFSSSWGFCAGLWPTGKRMGDNNRLRDLLPLGAVLAIAQLTDVLQTDTLPQSELDATRTHNPEPRHQLDYFKERWFGDFSLGRYAWKLEDVQPLATPIPAKGSLSLWDWTPPCSCEHQLGEHHLNGTCTSCHSCTRYQPMYGPGSAPPRGALSEPA